MKKTFKDIDVTGKRVFVRVDFNVPQDDSGRLYYVLTLAGLRA